MGNNSLGTTLSISSTNTSITGNVVDLINTNELRRGLSVSSVKDTGCLYFDPQQLHLQFQFSNRVQERRRNLLTTTNTAVFGYYRRTSGINYASANGAIAILGTAGASANDAVGVKGQPERMCRMEYCTGQAGVNDPAGIG
jgi:hypothetical protein